MPLNAQHVRILTIHVSVWILFVLYELSLVLVMGGQFSFFETFISLFLNASLFYVNAMVLMPKLCIPRRYPLYFLALLCLLAFYTWLRFTLNSQIFPALLHRPSPPATSYQFVWAQAFYRNIYFLFPSIAYWFAQNAIKLQKQKLAHEHELRVAEKNLMEANIAFLKNQINPHFLFNSLNFLYAQVYPHSEPAAKGILLLSDIMRYALKEDDNHGKVMLEKEVQHLHNYIALNQLRFNQQLQIRLEIEGSLRFLMILPLVLITFVENCIKHGELSDPQDPLVIELKTTDNQLFFRTHNKKRQGPKEKSTGIGLVNTRQRLDMAYPGKYSLTVTDAEYCYTCILVIEL